MCYIILYIVTFAITNIKVCQAFGSATIATRCVSPAGYRENERIHYDPQKIQCTDAMSFDYRSSRITTRLHVGEKSLDDAPDSFFVSDGNVNSVTNDGSWFDRYEELTRFHRKYGHCLVPRYWRPYPGLSHWLQRQRKNYKLLQEGKESDITIRQIRALEALGFEWSYFHAIWTDRLNELLEYKAIYGDTRVSQKFIPNPRLGEWVATQRYHYKLLQQKKHFWMTPDRIEALEAIGFEWVIDNEDQWNSFLKELKQFKAEHGHCRCPQNYPQNPRLGKWVMTQRRMFALRKNGEHSSISQERIGTLNDIGFDWSKPEAAWNERLEQLHQFKVKYGHCRVPRTYPDNPSLGCWVATQRTQRRFLQKGKPSTLTMERMKGLNNLGFEWSIVATHTSFEQRIEQLKKYKTKYNHMRVPASYSAQNKLGLWVKGQRARYKNGQLTEERIRALNGIGFVWSIR